MEHLLNCHGELSLLVTTLPSLLEGTPLIGGLLRLYFPRLFKTHEHTP